MYSHSSEKNFKCDECGRYYKSSDILRHHVRMVHKNLPKVTCDLCGKEVSRVSLKAHMNRHRERQEEEEESARHLLQLAKADDESAPRCRVCRSFVHNEKQLEMHHCAGRFDDSLFPCPDCTKSFKAASDLVRHTCSSGRDNSKSRNSSKVYKCIFCGREYNCHTPYLYHVRHHTGEKPYPCTECDKSFRLKQGLKVHMRNHTGQFTVFLIHLYFVSSSHATTIALYPVTSLQVKTFLSGYFSVRHVNQSISSFTLF